MATATWATASKKARPPDDLLTHKLGQRPQGTRCVLVLDPDRLLEVSRTLTDEKGRAWEVVIYRGDDVVTRRAWQRTEGGDRPVVLLLSRAEGDEQALDVSGVADLVSRAEGELIDLSLLGYFHSLFPRINPPPPILAKHRRAFLENVEAVVRAYPQLKERWHEPDSWTRGQFLAVLLLARFPQWRLNDVWCNEEEAAAFAAHAIGLLCDASVKADDLPAVVELIWESARHTRDDPACGWLDVHADDLELFRVEVAGQLVVRELLAGQAILHLDAVLQAKLPVSSFDAEGLAPVAAAVLAALHDSGRWAAVQFRAAEFLTFARLEKVADLLPADTEGFARLAESPETAPIILTFLVRGAILTRCQGKAAGWPAWIAMLAQHPLLARQERGEDLTGPERDCAALMSAGWQLEWVEGRLAVPVPAFGRAEELLDWYTDSGTHLLEYRTAEAFAKVEAAGDPALEGPAHAFIMERDGLRYRVRHYLNQLDRQLAVFVSADPGKFLHGPRSALRIIPEVVRGGGRARGRRVWILVMDGMRYDTWDVVVRPLLLEHFEVVAGQDRAYFSLLPSKTDIARRGLLAGAAGKDWKNYFNKPTKDERILAARALGVSKHDVESKVQFITDAETAQARAKMGYRPEDARDVNVLIYPISDDLGHHHNDTLAALNAKIRQQLLTQPGMRGIVDDLRQRVRPGDLVLVTSDHGFQELFPEERVQIGTGQALQQGQGDEAVAYRYLKFGPGKGWPIGDHVIVTWEELAGDGRSQQHTKFTLPVGGTWYQREKGRPARYAHGGISLAEMTIPGVLLQLIAQKTARIELLELPEEMAVAEDAVSTLEFELVNRGNVETPYELKVRSNLGEQLLEKSGTLASGKRERVACPVTGRYKADLDRNPLPEATLTAVQVELAHADTAGKMTRPAYGRHTVRVAVKPKLAKVETDALQAFDNL